MKFGYLEEIIMKELDRKRINQQAIAYALGKLDTEDKRTAFLSYLMENQLVLLTTKDIFETIKQINESNN